MNRIEKNWEAGILLINNKFIIITLCCDFKGSI